MHKEIENKNTRLFHIYKDQMSKMPAKSHVITLKQVRGHCVNSWHVPF